MSTCNVNLDKSRPTSRSESGDDFMTKNVLVGSKFESHQVRGMRARIHSPKNLVQTLTLILIALHYVCICIVPLLLQFCIVTLVAAAAARSPVTQPACAIRHPFRSREAEASKRRKVDKLILGFAREAGILTNMRNSQLPAAKQASKGRSSGLHRSIEVGVCLPIMLEACACRCSLSLYPMLLVARK